MVRTGQQGCPRCQGFVVKEGDELTCLNCGWHKYGAYNGQAVKPFSKKDLKEIVEEFGPPVEGLFEETHVALVLRRKAMARETARKMVKNGGKVVRTGLRPHVLRWPLYEASRKFSLC